MLHGVRISLATSVGGLKRQLKDGQFPAGTAVHPFSIPCVEFYLVHQCVIIPNCQDCSSLTFPDSQLMPYYIMYMEISLFDSGHNYAS